MTNEEIKKLTELHSEKRFECDYDACKALTMAIKAIEDIEKIKAIIRTPENFLEQDVYRYKMICEVIANECKTESKEV